MKDTEELVLILILQELEISSPLIKEVLHLTSCFIGFCSFVVTKSCAEEDSILCHSAFFGDANYSLVHLCKSVKYPFAFCSSYDYLLRYFLARSTPLYLLIYIFDCHIFTFEALVTLSSLEGVLACSVYGSAFLPGIIDVKSHRSPCRLPSYQQWQRQPWSAFWMANLTSAEPHNISK